MLGVADWQRAKMVSRLRTPVLQWASARKRRLIVVEFCRRVAHLLTQEHLVWLGQRMVEEPLTPEILRALFPSIFDTLNVIERYSDGSVRDEELEQHNRRWKQLNRSACSFRGERGATDPLEARLISLLARTVDGASLFNMSDRLLGDASSRCSHVVYLCNGGTTELSHKDRVELAAQCDTIRDVVQHPDAAATVAPKWKTETVVSLARGIYDHRAFDRMPILADALEEAGCDDPTILRHCRADAPHVRGCWVVD